MSTSSHQAHDPRERAEAAREAALQRQGGRERLVEFYRMARNVYRREALSAGLHGSWGRECCRGYRMARERLAREGRLEHTPDELDGP